MFNKDNFSLGGQLFLDFWKAEEKIFKTTASINENDVSWKLGLKYDYNSEFGIGVLYEKGIDMVGEIKIEPSMQSIDPFDTTGYYSSIPLKYYQILKFPDKLSFGFHKQIFKKVIFSSNLTVVYWNSLTNLYEDQLDFSTVAKIEITKNISGIFGFYFTDLKLDEENKYYSFPNHATFYNLGIKGNFDNFVMIAEFLNTTKASAKYRKQSIFKFQVNYKFNN